MVKESIVLGDKVSSAGLEVDKEKIDLISKLPPPTNIKGVRSCRIPITLSLHITNHESIKKREEEMKVLERNKRLVPSCFAIFTFEPLAFYLTSMPSCDLEYLTNILILCLILKIQSRVCG
ncbi:hypothetical protein Tco_0713492, partial [Tanacetum coccineum]